MTLKDYIYISCFIFSIAGAFFAFKYRVKRIEDNYVTVKNIIFLDKGGLNIVTNDVLAAKVFEIQKDIETEASLNAKTIDKIECLNENIIIIMTHMDLKPKKFIRRSSNK